MTDQKEAAGPAARPAREPHLRDYLRVLFVRRWVLLAVMAAVLGSTTLYVLMQAPIYRATCRLLLQPTQSRVMDIKQVYDPTFGAEGGSQMLRREFLETQYMLILSRPILEKVFHDPRLGFAKMPEFVDSRDPIKGFATRFSVRGLRNSYLAEVSFEWTDRELAKRTVDSVVDHYIRSCRERSLGVTEGGLDSLRAKTEELRPKVEARSADLQKFMMDHNMVSLEQTNDIVSERLKEISRNLTAAELRRIQAESRYKNIRSALEQLHGPDDMPEVIDSLTVRDLKLEYIRTKLQVSTLAGSLGERHPSMLAAAATLDTIGEKLQQEVRHVLAAAEADFQRAAQLEAELRLALAAQEKAVMQFNQFSTEYERLKESHATVNRSYNAVAQRIEEIDIAMAAGSREEGVFVETPAKVPVEAVRPRRMRAMAMAGFLALLLGAGVCFFLDYFDTSIKTKEDVEDLLGAAVLGYVPALFGNGVSEKDIVNRDLIAVERPHCAVAESFRSIRTALSFTRLEAGGHQIGVTSALPSEGKTLVSTNIAIAMAQSGQRVLLVDADLRRPRLHKVFGAESRVGLSNLLAGQGTRLADAVQPTVVPNLSLLVSGPIPPNPAELLGSPRMDAVMEELRQTFDFVVFDTPPTVNVTDSSVIARHVHGMVLVVRSFATDRAVATHARELLANSGARLLGVVLNGVDAPHDGYSYYYTYYKSNYYGEPAAAPGTQAG